MSFKAPFQIKMEIIRRDGMSETQSTQRMLPSAKKELKSLLS